MTLKIVIESREPNEHNQLLSPGSARIAVWLAQRGPKILRQDDRRATKVWGGIDVKITGALGVANPRRDPIAVPPAARR